MRKFSQLYKLIVIKIKILYSCNCQKYNRSAKVQVLVLLPLFEIMTIIKSSSTYRLLYKYVLKSPQILIGTSISGHFISKYHYQVFFLILLSKLSNCFMMYQKQVKSGLFLITYIIKKNSGSQSPDTMPMFSINLSTQQLFFSIIIVILALLNQA